MQKPEPRRQIWTISYPAACDDITPAMLESQGIKPDQWYQILSDSGPNKHLLIHLPRQNKKDETRVKNAINAINAPYNEDKSIPGCIVSPINDIDCCPDNYPIVKSIVEKLTTGTREEAGRHLKVWIDEDFGIDAIYDYGTKGLLWKYVQTPEVSNQLNGRYAGI